MNRKLGLGVIAALAISGASLLAQNPHYVQGPTLSVATNALTISFKATGLGNVPEVDFTVTGTVDVFSRCYNKGGNRPQADNKQETIDVQAAFSAPVRNGQTTVSNQIVAAPLSTLSCPGNQQVVVESVSYDLTLQAAGFPQLTANFSN